MKRLVSGPIALSLVFALACGNGRDIVNSPASSPSISISPTSANLIVNQTTQFEAKVRGLARQDVLWSVKQEDGGTVASGLYRAPSKAGKYEVTVTAVADTTKSATATINVSAVTAFLQELPDGVSTPLSVTPVLGIIHPDGSWVTAPILDPLTNRPMDTSLYDIFLSEDGTKAVGTLLEGATLDASTMNIVIFNSDGTGMTHLTNNALNSGSHDFAPQFSRNGQMIAYVQTSSSLIGSEVWVMNADGTSPRVLLSGDHIWASNPNFSPDGSVLTISYEQQIGDARQNGVAITNSDGSGSLVLLRVDVGWSLWSKWPAFSTDGTQIAFTSELWGCGGPVIVVGCQPVIPVYFLWTMNSDGSNAKSLPMPGGSADGFPVYANPRPLADRILFSSDMNGSYEIYSVMPDGSNLSRLTNNSVNDGFEATWINYPVP